jgi:hypothetical protein
MNADTQPHARAFITGKTGVDTAARIVGHADFRQLLDR